MKEEFRIELVKQMSIMQIKDIYDPKLVDAISNTTRALLMKQRKVNIANVCTLSIVTKPRITKKVFGEITEVGERRKLKCIPSKSLVSELNMSAVDRESIAMSNILKQLNN